MRVNTARSLRELDQHGTACHHTLACLQALEHLRPATVGTAQGDLTLLEEFGVQLHIHEPGSMRALLRTLKSTGTSGSCMLTWRP